MDEDVEMLATSEPLVLQLLYLTIVLTLGAIAGLALAALLSTHWVGALLAPFEG